LRRSESTTTLVDFDGRHAEKFQTHRYAFHVSNDEFDAIFNRIKADGIVYGSSPWSLERREDQ
jgi:hypothetical protein